MQESCPSSTLISRLAIKHARTREDCHPGHYLMYGKLLKLLDTEFSGITGKFVGKMVVIRWASVCCEISCFRVCQKEQSDSVHAR